MPQEAAQGCHGAMRGSGHPVSRPGGGHPTGWIGSPCGLPTTKLIGVTYPRRPSTGPIEMEFVGGPHDGRRHALTHTKPHVDTFQQGTEETLRYELDRACLDEAGQIITPVVRYLYCPHTAV